MRSTRNKFRLLAVFSCLVFMTACEYSYIDPIPIEDVSFKADIIPIFEDNCIACHNGGQFPDLRPENAYGELFSEDYLIDTITPENSVLYTKLLTGFHKDKCSDNDKGKILKWIELGAKDN